MASRPKPTRIEIAHLISLGIPLPALQPFTLSKIYDGGERLGIQTRAAHQRSVNFHLRHQPLDIVGLDASAVEDSQTTGAFRRKHRRCLLAQEPVRFRSDFRSRRAARANRPDGLVSKNDTRELRTGQRGHAAAKLPFKDLLRLTAFTLGKQLSHAQNRRQTRRKGHLYLPAGALVGLATELTHFRVRHKYGAASPIRQHRSGNLSGERTFYLPTYVLRGD